MGLFSWVFRLVAFALISAVYFHWFEIKSAIFAPPVSIADSTCERLWVARAQNDPALACYLKQKVSRLCDPVEREHLSWIFERYTHDRAAFGVDMAATLVSVNVNLNKEMAENPNGDAMAAMRKGSQIVSRDIETNGIAAAMRNDMIPRKTLLAVISDLGKKGLIAESDFGWFPDSLITQAFLDVDSSKITSKKACM